MITPMKIAIVSGKGGTGKMSLTAAFASSARNLVFADSEVAQAIKNIWESLQEMLI